MAEASFGISVLVILGIVLAIVYTWGIGCVLLISNKLYKSKAGRKRSSLNAVRKEAQKYIVPLFLTSILRSCFTFLWLLLLIIPGIIYSIRTMFFSVEVVLEDNAYRNGLRKTKETVTGNTWKAFWSVLGVSVILFLPATMVDIALNYILDELLEIPGLLIAAIISNGIFGILTIIFTLASMIIYRELLKIRPPKLEHIKPSPSAK